MRKVLIADASEPWRELLARALKQEYHIRVCTDGTQALELVERFEPDVLVLDLMLAGTDTISVLKALEGRSFRPRIIITGRYFSSYVTGILEQCQVDLAVIKPCPVQSITERIAELLDMADPAAVSPPDPYDTITSTLLTLGARTSQQGFRFLHSGIIRMMDDPHQQLTKSLYPAIAKEYNTSAANVEKGIRTAVYTAWSNRREDVWRRYFPLAPNGQIARPTSGQFLSRLADAMICANRRWA